MEDYAIHNFRKHRKGMTFNGKLFTFTAHPSGILVGAYMVTDSSIQLNVGSGITIIDAVNWVFKIDQQIINWAIRDYRYEIVTISSTGITKTFIQGVWSISN
jgi:hypothetical protein